VIEIRPTTSPDELRRAFVIWHYFGADPVTDEVAEQFDALLDGRMLAAWEGDAIVGGAGAFPFELSVPGGRRVRAGGVTVVGVLPTHRRRGILTRLMRRQLDDLHELGEPVAYLWASESTIYRRFGYGMAALQGQIRLPRERTAFAEPAPAVGDLRLVSHEEALELFPPVYDRVFEQRPGMFSRSRAWWDFRPLGDTPARRGSGGPLNRVVLELDGKPEGYALYRVRQAFESFASTGAWLVSEALATTPEATRALWRFLLDADWTATIEAAKLPLDHELFHLLAEPRRMRFEATDSLWVRLVDVGEALTARGYVGDGEVVLDVRDAFCPWNEGRWRVSGDGAERTDGAADIALDAAALGSAYLGGFGFRQLADALRVEELQPGAIARADALFRAERAPFCAEIF
jgi:predicted acetyltransferase